MGADYEFQCIGTAHSFASPRQIKEQTQACHFPDSCVTSVCARGIMSIIFVSIMLFFVCSLGAENAFFEPLAHSGADWDAAALETGKPVPPAQGFRNWFVGFHDTDGKPETFQEFSIAAKTTGVMAIFPRERSFVIRLPGQRGKTVTLSGAGVVRQMVNIKLLSRGAIKISAGFVYTSIPRRSCSIISVKVVIV